MKKADLHIHSIFSDGKYSPEEIIILSKKNKIDIISITDHDNIEGTKDAINLHNTNDIEIIPGIELSGDYHNREIHILGYFIDYEHPALIAHINIIKKLRLQRYEKILRLLNEMGVKIDKDEVLHSFKQSYSIGRPHIANKIVEYGYARDYNDAFIKFIGDNKPAYVKKENMDFKIIIELIHKTGGLAFIAHPSGYYRQNALLDIIKYDIDGIEIYHPSHTNININKLSQFAIEHNLLKAGGSDFHGYLKSDFENFGKYYIFEDSVNLMKSKLNLL